MSPLAGAEARRELERRRDLLAAATARAPREELAELVSRVDAALARLDADSFGLCAVCHEPVEAARIDADPLVEVCLDCLSTEEKRGLERDLRLAAGVQAALLPPRELADSGWEIHWHREPAGPVSGDHCDLIRGTDGGGLVFVFGDVSGKGVAASIQVAQLHALVRSLLALEPGVGALLGRANRLFNESTPASSYATLVVGRLGADGALELANAGHWPPLLRHGGRVRPLAATGLPFGLFSSGGFATVRVRLAPDDALLLYTDGLTEARDGAGEEYGEARPRALLQATAGLPAAELTQRLLADLGAFGNGTPRGDDLTVMTIRRVAAGE